LPARHYVFRVRASNNDGVWNETGATLAFTVQPLYWQTWWFRLGVALLLVNFGGATAWWQSRTRVRRALERERTANEIRELAGHLITAQEEERRRIARELHDDFSQRLALLSVEMELFGSPAAGGAEFAPKLSEMATRVKDLSTEVHRMAYELHPAKLDQLGLVSAARGFCRELSRQSGVQIDFEPGSVPRDLPVDLALCFYRVIQESLQNVVRHSGAREARVELRAEPNHVCLVVADSGRGFEVERRRQGGLGLLSMRERSRLIHATLTVRSEPGRGTRIEVRAPLVSPRTAV
jgi:signal transduction histidine kinase